MLNYRHLFVCEEIVKKELMKEWVALHQQCQGDLTGFPFEEVFNKFMDVVVRTMTDFDAEASRAVALRDQVLKTWDPPYLGQNSKPEDIAQTATMQTLAYVFGKEFLPVLTPVQEVAIDSGVALLTKVLEGKGENSCPKKG